MFLHPGFQKFMGIPSHKNEDRKWLFTDRNSHESLEKKEPDGKGGGGGGGKKWKGSGWHLFSSTVIIKVFICYARSFILNTLSATSGVNK